MQGRPGLVRTKYSSNSGLAIYDRDTDVGEFDAGPALAQAMGCAWRQVGGEDIGAPACGLKGGVQDVGTQIDYGVFVHGSRAVSTLGPRLRRLFISHWN